MKSLKFIFLTIIASFLLYSCTSLPKDSAPKTEPDAEAVIKKNEQSVQQTAPKAQPVKPIETAQAVSIIENSPSSEATEDSEEPIKPIKPVESDEPEVFLEKLDYDEYFLEKTPDEAPTTEKPREIKEPEIMENNSDKKISDKKLPEILSGNPAQTQSGIRKSLQQTSESTASQEKESPASILDNTTQTESESKETESMQKVADSKSEKTASISTSDKQATLKEKSAAQNTKVNSSAEEKSSSEEFDEEKNREITDKELEDFKKSVVIVPSREVTIKNNQYLDVAYPGTGWVYIGETEKVPIFRYFGRKLGNDNTIFSLRSQNPGKTLLHFYKNDALTGEYIDDYLQVTVEDKLATTSEKVLAPSYADVVPSKPVRRFTVIEPEKTDSSAEASSDKSSSLEKTAVISQEAKKARQNSDSTTSSVSKPIQNTTNPTIQSSETSDNVKTVIQNANSKAENSQKSVQNQISSAPAKTSTLPSKEQTSQKSSDYSDIVKEPSETINANEEIADDSLLEKAKKAFEEKKFEEALNLTNKYIDFATTKLDEAYYLLGQIYESDSSVKNIRNSLDSYEAVVKNFPTSRLWKNASNRTIYLKRFYIDIR